MKVLLFSLVLGLLVASQGEAQRDNSQFTGRWLSHYMAADNIEKISEGGPFHAFMRYIEFDEENGTILYHFYLTENGECIEKYLSGTKEEEFYAVDWFSEIIYNRLMNRGLGVYLEVAHAGHNEFRIISVDNNALTAHVINVDERGKETEIVQLFGAGDNVDSKQKEEFNNAVREKGIPEENVLNFIDNDNCPEK